jgi:hypothetical protein
MTDDGLQLLVDFRGEVPEADEETIRRIYHVVTMHRDQRRPLARRFPRRPRLLVAVVAAALLLVPAALAFGGKIVDLFEGTPAPPSVSNSFSALNRIADMATQEGFASRFPHADVSKAHGVLEIQTADGPEDLWAAPSDQGGDCWFIDFVHDPPGADGQKYGHGGCDPLPPPASNINWGDVWVYPHPSLLTVWGKVYVDAAAVQVTLADGSAKTLPVVEGLFLGSLDRDAKVTQLTAYDDAGNEVAQTTP